MNRVDPNYLHELKNMALWESKNALTVAPVQRYAR